MALLRVFSYPPSTRLFRRRRRHFHPNLVIEPPPPLSVCGAHLREKRESVKQPVRGKRRVSIGGGMVRLGPIFARTFLSSPPPTFFSFDIQFWSGCRVNESFDLYLTRRRKPENMSRRNISSEEACPVFQNARRDIFLNSPAFKPNSDRIFLHESILVDANINQHCSSSECTGKRGILCLHSAIFRGVYVFDVGKTPF